MSVVTMSVRLSAVSCYQVSQSECVVDIPAMEMSQEDTNVLDRLFPDLVQSVEVLIRKQAILNAVVR
jgi:hypothetical protein